MSSDTDASKQITSYYYECLEEQQESVVLNRLEQLAKARAEELERENSELKLKLKRATEEALRYMQMYNELVEKNNKTTSMLEEVRDLIRRENNGWRNK